MIENLKPLYTAFLKPVSTILKKSDIHPNVLTIAGVLLFCMSGWLLIIDHWKFSLLIGSIGAFMDGLDGILARETGKISKFGGILDSVCDRFTEIIWLGSFIIYYQSHQEIFGTLPVYLAFFAITGSIMVSYVRARAESVDVECYQGIMQRPERLIILAIFQLTGPFYMVFGLGIVALVSYITVFQRIIIAYRNAK